MIRRTSALLALFIALAGDVPLRAQGEAADFPPGTFTDGGQYQLADLKGKVVVLFFFESKCPRCRGSIPERSALVKSMQGKPVIFLAVGPNITAPEAMLYQRETGLAMPVFADGLGLMQARYGFQISLKNIWQFRVIGTDGKVKSESMTADAIDKVIKQGKAERTFKGDYNAKVAPAADFFEFGQYSAGAKALTPLRHNANKQVAESAQKLYDEAKAGAEKLRAAAAEEADPVKQYDLYAKIATAFPSEEVGKSAAAAARKLAATPAMTSELAARKAFAQIKFELATIESSAAVLKMCDAIVKKYPKTPTAEKTIALEKELRALVKK